jgi:hypothetical protein
VSDEEEAACRCRPVHCRLARCRRRRTGAVPGRLPPLASRQEHGDREGHPLFEAFGGIHHIYANDKALAGYRAGKFSDGAVIVFDLLDVQHDGGAIIEDERKVVGVMHKDAAKYAATGGWGFEGFAGGDAARPVVGDNAATACFECHQPLADRDYVFSSLRD